MRLAISSEPSLSSTFFSSEVTRCFIFFCDDEYSPSSRANRVCSLSSASSAGDRPGNSSGEAVFAGRNYVPWFYGRPESLSAVSWHTTSMSATAGVNLLRTTGEPCPGRYDEKCRHYELWLLAKCRKWNRKLMAYLPVYDE